MLGRRSGSSGSGGPARHAGRGRRRRQAKKSWRSTHGALTFDDGGSAGERQRGAAQRYEPVSRVVNGSILTRMTEPTRPLPTRLRRRRQRTRSGQHHPTGRRSDEQVGHPLIRLRAVTPTRRGSSGTTTVTSADRPRGHVISGIGEQPLLAAGRGRPPPAQQGLRGRLLTIGATVREIAPTDDACGRPRHRPAPGTAQPRRHHGGRRHAVAAGLHDPRPHPTGDHRATRSVCRGARFRRIAPRRPRRRWRPWHWRGRPQSRRGTPVRSHASLTRDVDTLGPWQRQRASSSDAWPS